MARRWNFRRLVRAGAATLPLVACVAVGLTIGTGGYTVWYGEGASYMSNDPATCVNCHVMRDHYDSWQKASHHANATCNDCHTPHDFLANGWSRARTDSGTRTVSRCRTFTSRS